MAIISWSPISILNYVFTAIGFVVSVVFLVRNLWPVVSVTDAKISRVLVIAVVVLHAGLAIAIKFTFFAQVSLSVPGDYILTHLDRHGSPAVKNTEPSSNGDGATNTTVSLLGF